MSSIDSSPHLPGRDPAIFGYSRRVPIACPECGYRDDNETPHCLECGARLHVEEGSEPRREKRPADGQDSADSPPTDDEKVATTGTATTDEKPPSGVTASADVGATTPATTKGTPEPTAIRTAPAEDTSPPAGGPEAGTVRTSVPAPARQIRSGDSSGSDGATGSDDATGLDLRRALLPAVVAVVLVLIGTVIWLNRGPADGTAPVVAPSEPPAALDPPVGPTIAPPPAPPTGTTTTTAGTGPRWQPAGARPTADRTPDQAAARTPSRTSTTPSQKSTTPSRRSPTTSPPDDSNRSGSPSLTASATGVCKNGGWYLRVSVNAVGDFVDEPGVLTKESDGDWLVSNIRGGLAPDPALYVLERSQGSVQWQLWGQLRNGKDIYSPVYTTKRPSCAA